jgi:hypothetical protein
LVNTLTKTTQLGFKHSHEMGPLFAIDRAYLGKTSARSIMVAILSALGGILLILGAKNLLLYANPIGEGNAHAVWRLLVTLWRMLWLPWKSRSVEA